MIAPWRRHDLLTVRPQRWPSLLPGVGAGQSGAGQSGAGHSEDSHLHSEDSHLRQWARRGWPLVVRRFRPDEPQDRIPVAVALPPDAVSGHKRPGPALLLRAADVRAPLPPVRLLAVRSSAPARWQPTLQALQRLAGRHHSEPAVVGSLLWQTLTGLRYLTARSDLDLLWPVGTADHATALARDIALLEVRSSMRIDGEFVLPDGAALSWREWLQGDAEILVKRLHGVEPTCRHELWA